MQFIFGDDTSKYTLLYNDDPSGSAEKIKEMIRIPYAPSPNLESIGFLPFGTNNNRALTFHFSKDTKMVRNVYILHGVYGDIDAALYGEDRFYEGIFRNFITQEQFDLLRDGAMPDGVPYSVDTALMSTPVDQIEMDETCLHDILTLLYQRLPVRVVMDDEKFTPERVKLILKKIYHYMTPSLRKTCSFVTAVEDVGTNEFLLRIMPRSMKPEKAVAVDLDAPSAMPADRSGFGDIVSVLMQLPDGYRKEVFAGFEELYYGADSIYRKQNFERFFHCFVGHDDPDMLEECDALADDFLLADKAADPPYLPEFLRKTLAERYASYEYLDSILNWDEFSLERYIEFFDQNLAVFKKVYACADPKLVYFDRALDCKYNQTKWPASDVATLAQIVDDFCRLETPEEGTASVCERIFYNYYLSKLAVTLDERCKLFEAIKAYITEYAVNYLAGEVFIDQKIPPVDFEALFTKLFDVRANEFASLCESLDGVDEIYRRHIFTEAIVPHNNQVEERRRAAEAKRKEEGLADILNRLKHYLEERVNGASDYPVEPPTEAEISDVAYDPKRVGNLAKLMAWYYSCRMMGQETLDEEFAVKRDKYLVLTATPQVRGKVVEYLSAESTLLALLYLLNYSGKTIGQDEENVREAITAVFSLPGVVELTKEEIETLRSLLPTVFAHTLGDLAQANPDILPDLAGYVKEMNAKAQGSEKDLAKCIYFAISSVGKQAKGASGKGEMKIDGSMIAMIVGAVILIGAIVGLAIVVIGMLTGNDSGDSGDAVTTDAQSIETPVTEEDVESGSTTGDADSSPAA